MERDYVVRSPSHTYLSHTSFGSQTTDRIKQCSLDGLFANSQVSNQQYQGSGQSKSNNKGPYKQFDNKLSTMQGDNAWLSGGTFGIVINHTSLILKWTLRSQKPYILRINCIL